MGTQTYPYCYAASQDYLNEEAIKIFSGHSFLFSVAKLRLYVTCISLNLYLNLGQ